MRSVYFTIAVLSVWAAGAAMVMCLAVPESPYGIQQDWGALWDGQPLTPADFDLKSNPKAVQYSREQSQSHSQSQSPESGLAGNEFWNLLFDSEGRVSRVQRPVSDGKGVDIYRFANDRGRLSSQFFFRDHPEPQAFTDFFHVYENGCLIVADSSAAGLDPYGRFPAEVYDPETPLPEPLRVRVPAEAGLFLHRETRWIFNDENRLLSVMVIHAYEKGYQRWIRKYRYDNAGRLAAVFTGNSDLNTPLQKVLEYSYPAGFGATAADSALWVDKTLFYDGEPVMTTTRQFSSDGKIIMETAGDLYENRVITEFQYDNKNRLAKKSARHEPAGLVFEQDYFYDSRGNWVRQETRIGENESLTVENDPAAIITRDISYWGESDLP